MSKQILSIFIFLLLASCNKSANTPSKEAIVSTDTKDIEPKKLEKIIIEDGKGEDVEVQVEDWVGIDPYTLKTLLNKLSIEAKYECKNTTSYRPYKKSKFSVLEDTSKMEYSVIYNYLAANTFGTEGELRTYWQLNKKFEVKEKWTLDLDNP
jgi:hypothetical protein